MGFNIFDLLLPRETKFFTQMEQQIDHLIIASEIFKDLVTKIEQLSEEEIKKYLYAIKEAESKGDEVEYKLIDELNRTFITPLDREDIHTLSINVDRALDVLTSISRKIEIYHIRKVPVNVCRFADIIVRIATESKGLIGLLEKKGDLLQTITKMHAMENEADDLFHECMAELFNDNNNPVYIIKFKEVYEHLESVVDAIDYVGKIVRGIKVKQG